MNSRLSGNDLYIPFYNSEKLKSNYTNDKEVAVVNRSIMIIPKYS